MIRNIVKIHADKCNGCGACATACHEGAIVIKNGKAELIRDDYCDGLGNCLPVCPTGAIEIIEREALPFDESVLQKSESVKSTAQTEKTAPTEIFKSGGPSGSAKSFEKPEKSEKPTFCGCPGSRAAKIERQNTDEIVSRATESRLSQWPVQIRLVPVNAPYFDGANLLVAADCTAYAYGSFHEDFIKNRIALIGCPKLDETDYSEKLTEIIKQNNIKSVTCVRMSVPCCGGIENAVKTALRKCGKFIPWRVVIIDTNGNIIEG